MLNKIYDEKKIETNIHRNIMKDLLYLCTKHFDSTYGGKTYIQIDGVAMGSLLDQLLANTFMIPLEGAILPYIKKHIAHLKRNFGDTDAYIDPSKLNLF